MKIVNIRRMTSIVSDFGLFVRWVSVIQKAVIKKVNWSYLVRQKSLQKQTTDSKHWKHYKIFYDNLFFITIHIWRTPFGAIGTIARQSIHRKDTLIRFIKSTIQSLKFNGIEFLTNRFFLSRNSKRSLKITKLTQNGKLHTNGTRICLQKNGKNPK